MPAMFRRLWKDESGQGMVEYGLIIALVAVAVIGVLATMGGTIKEFFQKAIDGLNTEPTTPSGG